MYEILIKLKREVIIMGKYQKYGQQVNDIAVKAFAEYSKAEAELNEAIEEKRRYPRGGGVSAEFAVKAASAEARYIKANEAVKAARKNLNERRNDIKAIKNSLVTELNATYQADPAKLDTNTLELMKSGILSSDEYASLLSKAQAAGNLTMCRMIAKYADDEAAAVREREGEDSQNARKFAAIAIKGKENGGGGSNELAWFNVLEEAYNTTADNPDMISAWGELTANAVNNL
jgi:hypothetical protein